MGALRQPGKAGRSPSAGLGGRFGEQPDHPQVLDGLIWTFRTFRVFWSGWYSEPVVVLSGFRRLARDQGASLQSWYNAAIDSQVRPGDVTGKRTAQEDDSVRDLINTTDSAKRNLANLHTSSLDLLP